jgi:nicotinamidase-related amidase
LKEQQLPQANDQRKHPDRVRLSASRSAGWNHPRLSGLIRAQKEESVLTIDPKRTTLLIVDFQARLMPAIDRGEAVIANALRLLEAGTQLGIPIWFTERNSQGLGPTIPELAAYAMRVVPKMTFDATRVAEFLYAAPQDFAFVTAGCEAHVCVGQTVLGLLAAKRKVYVVRDAIGARRSESKETAIRRMERNGAEIVTTEMVIFEWLETAQNPHFRKILRLIK